jgi:hypothetical protein
MQYIQLDPHLCPQVLYSPAANEYVALVISADNQYYKLLVHKFEQE